MKSFIGAKIQDLKHYVTPYLEHGTPGIAVTHIGSNNVSYNKLDIDASIWTENIIKVGKKCIAYGVEEVVISLPENIKSTTKILLKIGSGLNVNVSCISR